MKGKQNPNSVQYLRLTDYALLTFSFGYCLKINSNLLALLVLLLANIREKICHVKAMWVVNPVTKRLHTHPDTFSIYYSQRNTTSDKRSNFTLYFTGKA